MLLVIGPHKNHISLQLRLAANGQFRRPLPPYFLHCCRKFCDISDIPPARCHGVHGRGAERLRPGKIRRHFMLRFVLPSRGGVWRRLSTLAGNWRTDRRKKAICCLCCTCFLLTGPRRHCRRCRRRRRRRCCWWFKVEKAKNTFSMRPRQVNWRSWSHRSVLWLGSHFALQ